MHNGQERRSFIQKIAEFNDPQRALGAGISSYHQQLVHFFFLFLVLTLAHIPALMIYDSYNFFDDDNSLLSFSMGNLGFSENKCIIESMEGALGFTQRMNLECTSGKITKLESYGITTIFEDQQECSRNRKAGPQYCN